MFIVYDSMSLVQLFNFNYNFGFYGAGGETLLAFL